MRYFSVDRTTTAEILKAKYREYCKTMHPDRGGSHNDFIAMKKDYERALEMVNSPKSQSYHNQQTNSGFGSFADIITASGIDFADLLRLSQVVMSGNKEQIKRAFGNILTIENINDIVSGKCNYSEMVIKIINGLKSK